MKWYRKWGNKRLWMTSQKRNSIKRRGWRKMSPRFKLLKINLVSWDPHPYFFHVNLVRRTLVCFVCTSFFFFLQNFSFRWSKHGKSSPHERLRKQYECQWMWITYHLKDTERREPYLFKIYAGSDPKPNGFHKMSIMMWIWMECFQKFIMIF